MLQSFPSQIFLKNEEYVLPKLETLNTTLKIILNIVSLFPAKNRKFVINMENYCKG